jgi:lipid-binding SYLF domain-containing protein
MRHIKSTSVALAAVLGLGAAMAHAADYRAAIQLFKDAPQSRGFFTKSYGYAIYPFVGEGGFLIGAAHGSGRVYAQGHRVGDTSVTQLSVGWQAGGQAFSEIIFFEDKDSLDRFESGSFQFGAGASVVAITAGASANVGTNGAGAGASGGEKNAVLSGSYTDGRAVFTIVKGGLMYDASLEGEKFSFTANASK